MQQIVKLNHLRIAPRKVRLVAETLRGLSLNEAQAQLLRFPHRAAAVIFKLLHSAETNIKNKQANPDQFYIEKILVNQGSMMKRYFPRARGRATPIQKKSSHVFVLLSESKKIEKPRFKIESRSKKLVRSEKSNKGIKKKVSGDEAALKPTVVAKPGFFQKIFRRKSI